MTARTTRALSCVGAVLLAAMTVLLVLLATLPRHEPFLADTLSTDAYGPHSGLVLGALLLFGLAAACFAVVLVLRLRGPTGLACGLLVAVWGAASVFDAFVRTSRAHVGTSFGQLHTMLAVAGIVAQLVVSLVYLGVVRHRAGRVPGTVGLTTALVLAGEVFVAVHPDSLAGLSERVLIAASALWMISSAEGASAPVARAREASPPSVPARTDTAPPTGQETMAHDLGLAGRHRRAGAR